MDQNGYSFLIMVKGMKDFIRDIIEKKSGGILRTAVGDILTGMMYTVRH